MGISLRLISLLLSTQGSIFRPLTPSSLDSIGLTGEFENPVGILKCAGTEEHVESKSCFVCVLNRRLNFLLFSSSLHHCHRSISTVWVAAHTFPVIITRFQLALKSKEMPWTSFCLHEPQALWETHTYALEFVHVWEECEGTRKLKKEQILCKNRLYFSTTTVPPCHLAFCGWPQLPVHSLVTHMLESCETFPVSVTVLDSCAGLNEHTRI